MKKFEEFLKRNEKDGKQEIARVGLMSFLSDGSPRFIHRSFAEYFLSEYLVRNLDKKQVQKFLLEEILLENKHALIRKFFNSQLDLFFEYKSERENLEKQLEEKSILDPEFKEKISKLKGRHLEPLLKIKLEEAVKKSTVEALEDKSIGYKKNVLHQVAKEDHDAIVKFLLDKFKDDKPKFYKLVEDGFEGQTVLSAAAFHDKTKTVKVLLDWMEKNLDKDSLKKLVLKTDCYKKTVLHRAAAKGYDKIVETLLNRFRDDENTLKAMALATDDRDRTALHKAAKEGKDETVMALLKGLENHTGILKDLLKATDDIDRTALHWAVKENHTGIVEALLEKVKNLLEETPTDSNLKKLVLKKDKDGQTALHWAVKKGKKETDQAVNNLLEKVKNTFREEILKKLVLAKDDRDRTALHWAAIKGKSKTLKALLDKAKEYIGDETLKDLVLATDDRGRTALHWAAKEGKKEIVEALLKEFKDDEATLKAMALVSEYDKDLKPKIEKLKKEENNSGIIAEIIKIINKNHKNSQSDLNNLNPDKFGRTILHRVAEDGDTETVKTLFNRVRDDNEKIKNLVLATDVHDRTALTLAFFNEETDTAMALLDWVKKHFNNETPPDTTLKALVRMKDKNEQSPLHIAADEGKDKILKEFLKFVEKHIGKDTLEQLLLEEDKSGKTVLLDAACGNHSKRFKTLLNKANKDTLEKLLLKEDKSGKTAIHRAAWKGYDKIISHLLEGIKAHPEILRKIV